MKRGEHEGPAARQQTVDMLSEAIAAALRAERAAGAGDRPAEDRARIDLAELFYHVLGRLKYIVAAALIGAVVMGVYAFAIAVPKYEATSKLYILSQEDMSVSLSDLQVGALLTMDYQEVFKTWEVHEMVRTELHLNYSYDELQRMLTISNPSDTRLLYITISHEDAQLATRIANAYAQAAKTFILQTMDAREPNTFSIALVPGAASGMGRASYVLLGLALGGALSLLALCLRFILDERPRSPEDISQAAGIPTLAVVPLVNAESRAAKRDGARRKRNEKA